MMAKIMLDYMNREKDSQVAFREASQGSIQRDATNWGSSKNKDKKKKTFKVKELRRGNKDKRSYQKELLYAISVPINILVSVSPTIEFISNVVN